MFVAIGSWYTNEDSFWHSAKSLQSNKRYLMWLWKSHPAPTATDAWHCNTFPVFSDMVKFAVKYPRFFPTASEKPALYLCFTFVSEVIVFHDFRPSDKTQHINLRPGNQITGRWFSLEQVASRAKNERHSAGRYF